MGLAGSISYRYRIQRLKWDGTRPDEASPGGCWERLTAGLRQAYSHHVTGVQVARKARYWTGPEG